MVPLPVFAGILEDSDLTSSDSFVSKTIVSVPSRIIVKYKSNQDPKTLESQVSKTNFLSRSFNTSVKEVNENINKLKTIEDKYTLGSEVVYTTSNNEVYDLVEKDPKQNISTEDLIKEYESLSNVDSVFIDYPMYALATTNDYYYVNIDRVYNEPGQWYINRTSIPQAWDITKGNSEVIIAVLDTGTSPAHPDLSSKIIAYYNCISSNAYDLTSPCTSSSGMDGQGHGTHVAGIAAATTNNSIGIAGAGYNTKIVSFKTLDDSGSGYASYNLRAFNHLKNSYSNKKVIINMSLGGPVPLTSYNPYLEAVKDMYDSGFIIVAAAGNDNENTMFYPAAASETVSVGALNRFDTKASYSNYGSSWVDVSSPGGDLCTKGQVFNGKTCLETYFGIDKIASTYPTSLNSEGYAILAGTSMATPLVSGILSLVWSANTNLTNKQVVEILLGNTDSDYGKSLGYWKYGKVNAYKSVLAAKNFVIKDPNDFDDDGLVSYKDTKLLMSNLYIPNQSFDLNFDGSTDIIDFVLHRSSY